MYKKKISVIVPIYNTSKFLDKCVSSILKQTFKNIEVILVNDGSTDNSLKKINQYKEIDNRIIIIDKENGGLSSARNAGIKISSGDYILNVDSDDWIEPNTCQVLMEAAINNNADIAVGNIYLEYKNKKQKWEDLSKNTIYKNFEYLDAFFVDNGKGSVCNKLIKRDLYIENKIFHPENISLGEDGCTLLRLILKSKIIIKIPNYVYHYRQNEFSMMHLTNKKIYEYIEGIKIIKNYYYSNKQKNKYKEIEAILKYRFFYKHLFLAGYPKTKKLYKKQWNNLNKEIVNLKNSRFYKYLSINEKILLNTYEFNKILANFLLIIYLKLIKRI